LLQILDPFAIHFEQGKKGIDGGVEQGVGQGPERLS
jgi:hypothetical protein